MGSIYGSHRNFLNMTKIAWVSSKTAIVEIEMDDLKRGLAKLGVISSVFCGVEFVPVHFKIYILIYWPILGYIVAALFCF